MTVAKYDVEILTGPYAHMTWREKFWLFVRPAGAHDCWEWLGHLYSNGYGDFRMCGTSMLSHRAAYEILRGEIPPGMVVCHSCDNRKCVNPRHLFVGTQQENVQDMLSKGRGNPARGERSGRSKLRRKDVINILRMLKDGGMTHKEIASIYGVNQNVVSRIKNGKRWAHVKLTARHPDGDVSKHYQEAK